MIYYAKAYGRMWPEHVKEVAPQVVVLQGFKPEEVQGLYTPGRKPGKLGWVEAREFLREMGQNA